MLVQLIKDIKRMLNITDDEDFLLEVLIKQSIEKIKKYLNIDMHDEELISKYYYALVLCVKDAYVLNKSDLKNKNVQTQTQGQRSVTYNTEVNNGLSDDVKACLPLPKVRVM